MRTVEDCIKDLRKEAQFQGRIGAVLTVNLIDEAVYFLRKQKKEIERLKEDDRK